MTHADLNRVVDQALDDVGIDNVSPRSRPALIARLVELLEVGIGHPTPTSVEVPNATGCPRHPTNKQGDPMTTNELTTDHDIVANVIGGALHDEHLPIDSDTAAEVIGAAVEVPPTSVTTDQPFGERVNAPPPTPKLPVDNREVFAMCGSSRRRRRDSVWRVCARQRHLSTDARRGA